MPLLLKAKVKFSEYDR